VGNAFYPIPIGKDFAFEWADDGWYDVYLREMGEDLARHAVATVLSFHLGREVKTEEVVFLHTTE
jgi:hypothetical protein